MRVRDVALVIGLVVVVVLLFGLLGGGMMGYGWGGPWGGWMGPGMMGGFGFGWGIPMLLFWALVIGGVALLAFRILVTSPAATTPGGPGAGNRALDILCERYARAEISKEQFDQMRRDLE
ncbi:MAG: hypothetical protein M1380_02730 [Chloroflexi bacterium]|nr:hypothetical protein [Chloroflexota bacterium]